METGRIHVKNNPLGHLVTGKERIHLHKAAVIAPNIADSDSRGNQVVMETDIWGGHAYTNSGGVTSADFVVGSVHLQHNKVEDVKAVASVG